MWDEMRMRTACFARVPPRCTSRLSKHFLLTFQEVTPLSKTRNQLNDIRGQHPPGVRAEVAGIMRGPRGDQKSLPGAQYNGGTSLYPHLDLAGDNIADLFARMHVPSGLDSRRDQRLHLHHLVTW